jgi:signal transduction histidine kinase
VRTGLVRLPLSSWPWRAVAYVVARLPLPALGAAVALAPLVGGWSGAAIAVPLLGAYVAAGVALAPVERRVVTVLGRPTVADPHGERTAALAPLDVLVIVGWGLSSVALIASPVLVDAGPVAAGIWTVETQGEAWIALPVGVVFLVAGSYAIVALAEAHAWLARTLLGPRGDELQRQVTELSRSRLRLIDAFDVERRRIERDLHDGAQQRLVSLALALRTVQATAPPELTEVQTQLSEAAETLSDVLEELQEMSRGIHPAILSEGGLGPALKTLARRSAVPIELEVHYEGPLPERAEVAAYYVVSEALTNAAKHAGASAVHVQADVDGDLLRLAIRDDGVGGADPARGSGLIGLKDRVEAVGGTIVVESPVGAGTSLLVELPVNGGRPQDSAGDSG